jgi:hypothetical protein
MFMLPSLAVKFPSGQVVGVDERVETRLFAGGEDCTLSLKQCYL